MAHVFSKQMICFIAQLELPCPESGAYIEDNHKEITEKKQTIVPYLYVLLLRLSDLKML